MIESVISRHRERLELLDRLEDEAGEGGAALEQMAGTMVHTMSMSGHLHKITEGRCDISGVHSTPMEATEGVR